VENYYQSSGIFKKIKVDKNLYSIIDKNRGIQEECNKKRTFLLLHEIY
jgi:hypothetical protein